MFIKPVSKTLLSTRASFASCANFLEAMFGIWGSMSSLFSGVSFVPWQHLVCRGLLH